MQDIEQKRTELLELANSYPSPHNGQPMQLVATGDNNFDLYFVTERGLKAAPISYLFSFVTIGVFIRHLEYCAQALGHTVGVELKLPKQSAMANEGRVLCASLRIDWDARQVDSSLQQTIQSRQTSRKKYQSGLSADERHEVIELAAEDGITAKFVTPTQAQHVIWLNQRAVFDDMFDSAVRTELDHWMRYTQAEKHAHKDGLSYDCMELSGGAMHFAVRHYKVLHWPIVSPLLRSYYLRTMKDDSSVGYFLSPFQTEMQAYRIGRAIISCWLALTTHGHYLHPFGTIVSNDRAHADFIELVGLTTESRADNYVTFIFRAGASPRPVESDRLPIAKLLYNQQ